MDDEDNLMERFETLFWDNFVAYCFPGLGIVSNAPALETPVLTDGLRALLMHAREASVTVSPNEEIEDVQTSTLLLQLAYFAIGHIIYHKSEFAPDTRLCHLKQTMGYWNDFLRTCFQLGVIKQRDMRCRTTKIDAVRRQTMLKDSVTKVRASKNLDEYRAEVIDVIEYFGIHCQSDVRFVEEELELLAHLPATQLASNEAPLPTKKPWTLKLDQTNIRTLFSSKVFTPDISMPTMSLADSVAQEMLGLRVQSPHSSSVADEKGYYQRQRASEVNDENKARIWDDWKDDNPRGSGNKMVNLG